MPVTLVFPFNDTTPVPVENVPKPVCEKLPDVVIPVAPVIAPAEVTANVGELIKLVKPVAEAKLIPLITLLLLLDAVGKLMPFVMLELFALLALVSEMLVAFTVVAVAVVLALVTFKSCALELFVLDEYV